MVLHIGQIETNQNQSYLHLVLHWSGYFNTAVAPVAVAGFVCCQYQMTSLLVLLLLLLQALFARLQSCPSQVTLEQVKDILPYASTAWLDRFSMLNGPGLLIDALGQHLAACRSQVGEAGS